MKFTALIPAFLASAVSATPLDARAASTVRHFYTGDANGEYARSDGFTGSSVMWGYGLNYQAPGTVPMYRCRNVGRDLWLLTTDSNCENSGYQLEGNVAFIYTSQVAGTQPWDRYFTSNGDHMYVRRDVYPDYPGYGHSCDYGYYNQEGTTGYIFTSGGDGRIPIYMFAKGRHSDHDPCAGNN